MHRTTRSASAFLALNKHALGQGFMVLWMPQTSGVKGCAVRRQVSCCASLRRLLTFAMEVSRDAEMLRAQPSKAGATTCIHSFHQDIDEQDGKSPVCWRGVSAGVMPSSCIGSSLMSPLSSLHKQHSLPTCTASGETRSTSIIACSDASCMTVDKPELPSTYGTQVYDCAKQMQAHLSDWGAPLSKTSTAQLWGITCCPRAPARAKHEIPSDP